MVMDKHGKIFIFLIILLVAAVLVWGLFFLGNYKTTIVPLEDDLSTALIADFESCAAAGNPVMESYPEQCRTPDGRTFTREIGNELEKTDLIRIITPRPGDAIQSPLQIIGEARGYWYFEASFPIELQDANGEILVSHYATAEGEWMTEDFVPFKATVNFPEPAAKTGFLILRKDNPSGLLEYDDTLIIPLKFSASSESKLPIPPKSACWSTGCSGQICSDEDMITTCEFRSDYACYKESFAVCERQESGECGWTESQELRQCLAGKKSSSPQIPSVPPLPVF